MSQDDPSGGSPKTGQLQPAIRSLAPGMIEKQFKPGQSGNPSGRPKANKEMRRTCRELALKTLERIRSQIEEGPQWDEDARRFRPSQVSELTQTFKTLAEYGGLLAPDKLSVVESSFARLLLAISATETLSAEQKQLAIKQVNDLHTETMGEDE